jgi:hypothetical protein
MEAMVSEFSKLEEEAGKSGEQEAEKKVNAGRQDQDQHSPDQPGQPGHVQQDQEHDQAKDLYDEDRDQQAQQGY